MTQPVPSSPTPYIPNTDTDREQILARLGLDSAERLFDELPAAYRDAPIELPPALSELELVRLLNGRAAENRGPRGRPSSVPAPTAASYPLVAANLVEPLRVRDGVYALPARDQPGHAAVRLRVPVGCLRLTGMDVSNTGLYDVASAAARGLPARGAGHRVGTPSRCSSRCTPTSSDAMRCLRVRRRPAGRRRPLCRRPGRRATPALVVQQPDFLGTIVDLEAVSNAAHAVGALCVIAVDPFALGMLRAPGDAGADIVVGEGRDLAGPIVFGGPSLGLFAPAIALSGRCQVALSDGQRSCTVRGRGRAQGRASCSPSRRESSSSDVSAPPRTSLPGSRCRACVHITLEALGPRRPAARRTSCATRRRTMRPAASTSSLASRSSSATPGSRSSCCAVPLPPSEVNAAARRARDRGRPRCLGQRQSPRHAMRCSSA